NQRERGFEVFVRLAGVADDEVRRNRDAGPRPLDLCDLLLVLRDGMSAFHCRQYSVRAVLHGKVQEARQLVDVRVRLDERVRELDGMRGREADALDAVETRDEVNQRREIRDAALVQRAAVSVDVLPKQ